jgi:Flp pilus assembly pilin Flp
MHIFEQLLRDDAGIVATEYVIMVALVALAIVIGAAFLGTQINSALNEIGNRVQNCGAVGGPCQ